jgi:hypothetical protein
MPPKKPGKDGELDPTEKLYRVYRKNLAGAGIPMPKKLEERFAELRNGKIVTSFTELIVWDDVGPEGMRVLADTLRDLDYKLLRQIRLWGARIEDDGLRSLCQFLDNNHTIVHLELKGCGITGLGCVFLANTLGYKVRSSIAILKLDHNDIGSAGCNKISESLAMNVTITELSLTYCNLEAEAADGLFEALIFMGTSIRELDLTGNHLRNPGIVQLMKAFLINRTVKKLTLADNQFGEDPLVLEGLKDVLHCNDCISFLDLNFNGFYVEGVTYLRNALIETEMDGVRKNNTLQTLILPDKFPKELYVEIIGILSTNKKKKKKGKKGKKGKKSKKK